MAWIFGDFHLDPERFELRHGTDPVSLEPQVLALLVHLVRHRDRLVTKDEISETIWQGRFASDASISSRMRSARMAVGDDGQKQRTIRTVHGRGFRFVADVVETVPAQVTAAPPRAEADGVLTGRPSIAIMPFRPLALEPDLAILADAIPYEIIQALSRLRWLAVIARGSSFRFRKPDPDLDLVATALGARYVLSGVIEANLRGLAVTLELSDCSCNEVIWGDRIAAPLDAIDDLRSRIVAHLVTALEVYIPLNEARIAKMAPIETLDAWANYHLGLQHLYRFTAPDNLRAKGCFERALTLDPGFVRAHAGLSFTSFLEAFLHLGPDVAQARRAARRHAERGLELDPLDPFANFTMGRSHWLTHDLDAAAEWLDRATRLNPNYAQGFYSSALTSMLTGNVTATETGLDMAFQLSPLDPLLYGIHGVRSQLFMQTGDYATAARWGDRAATTPGAHYLIAMIAMVANGLDGRDEQAKRWRQTVRRLKPDASAAHYFTAFPTRDTASRSRIADDLTRQGF
ncbi:MAG: winged helix-turn-helix domain-containing protein [Hoeflea sp.]|uniref:winged helix-turn-helix domain-containing tetratricopeptide repeat protein n=1 Tax=Hoeflea sp. TaxID=1940281 RepID=UPI001E06FBD7|nr:winged helix-turn-helix domain-containing protein [Hoeflea sp.]MBU4530605.1 winged helix-turn-helix domain-containing protein [Alphaproteobacteria bacterium]MBU4545384.1 winged helix-turn-helix domain-containing protein [Alphaproteobacteria bacterium]MBU4552278.1 winged helix-turn-helix domain-containing protein [Alphaproteobacteria bacterium]MBV1721839.1 winged helix-turn-helix domain-containing protein [Hoeflea sp.]MBV1761527.1 winged helix-turn-helix domain-containing protein [Hoeflea sp